MKGMKLFNDVNTALPLDEIAAYMRGGKVVASFSKTSGSTKETMKNSLVLHIALDERNKSEGMLYLDDRETYKYLPLMIVVIQS